MLLNMVSPHVLETDKREHLNGFLHDLCASDTFLKVLSLSPHHTPKGLLLYTSNFPKYNS